MLDALLHRIFKNVPRTSCRKYAIWQIVPRPPTLALRHGSAKHSPGCRKSRRRGSPDCSLCNSAACSICKLLSNLALNSAWVSPLAKGSEIRNARHAIHKPIPRSRFRPPRSKAATCRENARIRISFSIAIVQQITDAITRISMTPFTTGSALANNSITGRLSMIISNAIAFGLSLRNFCDLLARHNIT